MNCPQCGRPVSPTANICPRCKAHLTHTDDNTDYQNNPKEAKLLADNPNAGKHKAVKVIVTIVIILAVLVAAFIIFKEQILDFAKQYDWLDWFTKLFEK